MKIILAAPRGFCAGVNMAIESLDLAIRAFGTPIYVYHEIVHNKYVVETFRAKGAVFVDDLADVPRDATLLFSAHGVSPEIRRLARERRLRAIDATCPLVTAFADGTRQGVPTCQASSRTMPRLSRWEGSASASAAASSAYLSCSLTRPSETMSSRAGTAMRGVPARTRVPAPPASR